MSTPGEKLARLDDYVTGAMADGEAASYEETMFGEASESANEEIHFWDRIALIAPWFARRGGFGGGTRAQLDRLREEPRTHYFELHMGDNVIEPWAADTSLVTYRVGVDLRGYEAIDVHITTPGGDRIKTFHDCQYDPADGALYGVCDEPLARISFLARACDAKVEGTRDGKRETVGSFSFRPAVAP